MERGREKKIMDEFKIIVYTIFVAFMAYIATSTKEIVILLTNILEKL